MANKPSRIGFVDYALENYHANVYLAALRNELKDRGFTVTGCTAMKEKEGLEWAAKNNVPYFASLAELDTHVDCYMVLAPSNPEVHYDLCKKVFPFRKTTYVDKTFTTDLATARKIFALADKNKVKMQTTSALRYTNVQAYVKEVGRAKVRHMVAWGGGRSFMEYGIHPVEMVVSCMGPGAKRLMRRGTRNQSQLLLDFSGGRTAVINVYVNADTPFSAGVTTDQATKYIAVDGSRLFIDMAAAVLDLFEAGKPNIDRAESLMVRRILDAAEDPRALKGFIKL
jgi:predicted dehydrogenase